MDPGSLSLSVRAVIVCLLGAARCSSADKSSCSCSEIPVLPLTDPPPENCSRDSFRYTCIDGYLRKAGTSNLIKCSGSNSAAKWTTATLRCIPDPRRTTTRPPKSPVTTASFTNLQMTKSGSFSSTGLLEKNSLEPTSLSVQVDHSQASFTNLQMTKSGSFSSTGLLEKNSLEPTSLGVQVDHSQASFTNLQMTKSGSFSSTGLLEKNSLEPTSLSVQVDHSQASFTNLQMTKSGSFSSTGLLEKNSLEPTSLGVQVDHSQASFTNLQMTKSGSFSSTGLLEKNSLEPTSLGVQVDHSQATDRTTPASSNQPPNNRTDSPPLSGHTDHRLGTTTTALIVCASLVIVCALIGISYVCNRRKSQRNDRPATDEEKISMNHVPAEPAS
ncbi:interleukin-15 receptor subunit alpha [Hippoglossus hippoglossus]|uniref:interleukin-15 receptor subunit alpha n=1 Tax=Hippoglossus hippoglossus TaxID=8267 RepID=UPI00148C0F5A|nr:interleukin-15 receptor subunit alpha [Hippoglossus hippoglossus]